MASPTLGGGTAASWPSPTGDRSHDLKNCMYRTLLAAVALAVSSVTASAETITVCASGCDYTSINAAISAASDGDVIQLAAETYFEGEQIDTLGKAITLRGVLDKAGEPASVLDGAGTHRVLICQSGETSSTSFENLLIQNGRGQIEELLGGNSRLAVGCTTGTQAARPWPTVRLRRQLGTPATAAGCTTAPAARP